MSADGSASSVPYTNTTTEFDDILIDKGIITKEQALLAHGMDPDQVATILVKEKLTEMGFFDEPETVEPTKKEVIASTPNGALDELEEDEDFCDESFLQEFRQKRLEELKASKASEKFGMVTEITKADWVREVNEASQVAWVLVLLLADHVDGCGVLQQHFISLAAKFRAIKFVTIPARSAVENFPDSRLPALFAYKDGELQHQLITLDAGLYGLRCREQDVEWWLACKGVLKTDLEAPPCPPTGNLTVFRSTSAGIGANISSSKNSSSSNRAAFPSSSSPSSQRRFVGSSKESSSRRIHSREDEDEDDADTDEYGNGGRVW